MTLNLKFGDTELIIVKAKKYGLFRNQLAYVLATAYWETARTMKPVREAFWLSENWRKNNLRYYPWYGRGYVQLTWKRNYELASSKIGHDFIKYPDDVMKPEYSAEILVLGSKEGWFTKRKLSDYITLNKSDYIGARRIINGTDKAKEIADLAVQYEKLLLASGYGLESSEKPVQEVSVDTPSDVPQKGHWLVRLLKLLIKVLR